MHWSLFLPLSCSHHEVNSSESVNPVPTHYATPLSQLGIRQILQKILFHTVVFVLVRLETKVLPESKRCITKKTHLFIHHIQDDDVGLHETVSSESESAMWHLEVTATLLKVVFQMMNGRNLYCRHAHILKTDLYSGLELQYGPAATCEVYLYLYFLRVLLLSVLQWILYYYSNKAVSEQPFCLTFISCAVLKKLIARVWCSVIRLVGAGCF